MPTAANIKALIQKSVLKKKVERPYWEDSLFFEAIGEALGTYILVMVTEIQDKPISVVFRKVNKMRTVWNRAVKAVPHATYLSSLEDKSVLEAREILQFDALWSSIKDKKLCKIREIYLRWKEGTD